MSWGVELWDQYEKISGHTDQGIEFVKRVSIFIEKRVHAEQNYAKELRRLVKGAIRKEDDDSSYSAMKGFSKMIHEVNDLAGQRELISEYMDAEVLQPLKELARDITIERKKHLTSGTELQRLLKASMDMLERSKKLYEKASEEAETAMHKLERADNDPNSTKAKIDQLTTTLRQKEQTAEDCRNNYILQLERTNAFRHEHYNSTMPALFTEIQTMNERRINKYMELVETFAECNRRVFPVINTCLDNIVQTANTIDATKDNQHLIDEIKTGFPIPGDVDFEEYQGKQAKKNLKRTPAKVEPREDYSHLPPEQRRKRLQHKVNSLETQLNKAISDKTAMAKMQTIYTQNPKLGDPNTVQQSLEQNEAKINEFNAELEKFRKWLADASEQLTAEPSKPTKATGVFSKPSKASPKPPKKSDKKKGKGVESDDQNGSSPPSVSHNLQTKPNAKHVPSKHSSPHANADTKEDEWSSGDEDDDDSEVPLQPEVPGRVLYDFEGQNEDELSVQAEDQVVILQDLGDGWLRVRRRQEEGYVPESYILKI